CVPVHPDAEVVPPRPRRARRLRRALAGRERRGRALHAVRHPAPGRPRAGEPLLRLLLRHLVHRARGLQSVLHRGGRLLRGAAGASSSNDMYLATARYMFTDNAYEPKAIGHGCVLNRSTIQYRDTTIADLMAARGLGLAWYAEGYRAMVNSWLCPSVPSECTT